MFGSVFSIAIVFWLLVLARSAPAGPGDWALFTAVSGTAGVLMLQIHCPITLHVHLGVGHATVPFAMLAVGLGVARYRAIY